MHDSLDIKDVAPVMRRGMRARSPKTAESSENYPSVIKFNERWRVIVCQHGLQWILQHCPRNGQMAWRASSHCQLRNALIRCVRERVGAEQAAAVEALCLPEHIGDLNR